MTPETATQAASSANSIVANYGIAGFLVVALVAGAGWMLFKTIPAMLASFSTTIDKVLGVMKEEGKQERDMHKESLKALTEAQEKIHEKNAALFRELHQENMNRHRENVSKLDQITSIVNRIEGGK
jgi:hypothetical protein